MNQPCETIKRVAVELLVPGMFVHDMNCGWTDHPFMFNSMKLNDEKQIAKILDSGVKEVYIDSSRGLDICNGVPMDEVGRVVEARLAEIAQKAQSNIASLSMQEALPNARIVHSEALKLVSQLMHDARFGRLKDIAAAHETAEQVTDAIRQSSSAFISLCHIKNKDQYTFQHSVSVGALLVAFASTRPEVLDLKALCLGGLLHDLGKMCISDSILKKPGKLSDSEFLTMKSHVAKGEEILGQVGAVPALALEVLSHHHERHDGSGYPHGIKGVELSLAGKMAAIVDVYDAISSTRCYHTALQPNEALRKLVEWSEFHFDARLVEDFICFIGIYPSGSLVELDSGLLGVVIEQNPGKLLQPLVRIIFDKRRQRFMIPSKDIDLSVGSDKVKCYANTALWDVDTLKILSLGQAYA